MLQTNVLFFHLDNSPLEATCNLSIDKDSLIQDGECVQVAQESLYQDLSPTASEVAESRPRPATPDQDDDVSSSADFRRGSILSFSSVASTTYFSAEDGDGMDSEATLDYYSPEEGDFPQNCERFRHDSDLTPSSSDFNILPPYFLNPRLRSAIKDDDLLFLPRPLTPEPPREQDGGGGEETNFQITSFTSIPAYHDESIDSGDETPVAEMSSDDDVEFVSPPKFTEPLQDITTTQDESVTLTCVLETNPEASVAWFKGSNLIGTIPPLSDEKTALDDRFKVRKERIALNLTKYSLSVFAASSEDEGEYSVTATNRFGSGSCNATVVIQQTSPKDSENIAPSFALELCDVEAKEGDDVIMTCDVSGHPAPEVEFLHNEGAVDEERCKVSCIDGHIYRLHFGAIQRNDEGVIRACAKNPVGKAESSAEIFVDFEKALESGWNSSNGSLITAFELENDTSPALNNRVPYFDEIMEDLAIVSGDDATFSVRIFGEPPPVVRWLKGDCEVTDVNAVRVHDNEHHSLIIKGATSEQSGVYACQGINQSGEVTCKAELSVRSPNATRLAEETLRTDVAPRRDIKSDYTVGDVIKRGAVDTTRRVIDKSTSREFAAKYVSIKCDAFRKALNEIGILSRLRHKNIIAYCDNYRDAKYSILVTQLCQVELFDHFLSLGVVTENIIATYMKQLCEALAYLHERNIVHLDLKPENLILASDKLDCLKLADFTSAANVDTTQPFYWDWGVPDFVSPEIVSSLSVTSSSDMWTVGVMTYIAVSGISPFAGETDRATLLRVRDNTWSFGHSEFAVVSDHVRSFIESLLNRSPSVRMSASQCIRHDWIAAVGDAKQSEQRKTALSTAKLKYFQSRRTWQRSLLSGKSSLEQRSVSSLLRGDHDSSSLFVRKIRSSSYSSSSESDTEDEGVVSVASNKISTNTISVVKDPSPIQTSSPIKFPAASKAPAQLRRDVFSQSRSSSASMDRPLQLRSSPSPASLSVPVDAPVNGRKKLSSIGKKVSFEDEQFSKMEDDVFVEIQAYCSPLDVVAEQRPADLCLSKADYIINDKESTNDKNAQGRTGSAPSSETNATISDTPTRGSLSDVKDLSPTSGCCVHPSMWNRSTPPQPPPNLRVSSGSITKKPPKGILKKSGSFEKEPSNSCERMKTMGENFPFSSNRWKPLIKSPSFDVSGGSARNSPTGLRRLSTAARRRLMFRRGTSAESALVTPKTNSWGLRGPLMERHRPDLDLAGARMRCSPTAKKMIRQASTNSCSSEDRRSASQTSSRINADDDDVETCSLARVRPLMTDNAQKIKTPSCQQVNEHEADLSTHSSPEVTRVQGDDVWLTRDALVGLEPSSLRYHLEYNDSEIQTWMKCGSPVGPLSYHVTGLKTGVTYRFRVAAVNQRLGKTSYSDVSAPLLLSQLD